MDIADAITRRGAEAATGRTAHACHHCGQPATRQWQRQATDDEHEQHWAAVETNIRASNSGNPATEYVADRTDTVTNTVFGCDDHPDPCPGRAHDADCQGWGHCRCTITGEVNDG